MGGGGNRDLLNITIRPNAGGFPSATILAGSDQVGVNGWIDFPFVSRPTLSAGTVYWIVAASAEPAGQGYVWTHSNADVVPGFAEQDFGAGWTVTGVTDLTYVTYGIGLEPRIPVGLTVDRPTAPIGGTYAYTVYLNETGLGDARTAQVNLTLPPLVSYVSDTASLAGGVRAGPSNWTFATLANGPHAFGVSVRVGGSAVPGSTLAATVHLDYADSGGVPQPPSTATASIVVGLESKPMYLASDGVPDRVDLLRAAPPTGALGDFDGDGIPGFTLSAGGNATWTLAPPIARALHLRGSASVVLFLRSASPPDTVALTLTLFDRGATATRVASVTASVSLTNAGAYPPFTFDLGALDYWVPRGDAIELVVSEVSGGDVYLAYNAAAYPAALHVSTDTYVSVDRTTVTDTRGPSPFFSPKDTIRVLANVSDPFGSAEIAGAIITLVDPTGLALATNATVPAIATDPGTPSLWKAFAYPVPALTRQGRYTFTVAAVEGNGVRSTASGSFDVRAPVLSLALSQNATLVPPLGTVRYTVTVNNTGAGNATAWLNSTLPSGLAYASDSGASIGGARTGDTAWTFASLAPGAHTFDVTLRVAADAAEGSHLPIRFDLVYRDEKGFLWGVPGVSSELVVRGSSAPVNPLLFVLLALVVVVPPLAYVLWRRRRGTIEEAFLIHRNGLLLCHLSRRMRVVEDKDHDVLGGMLTAVQNFVRDSFRYGKDRELDKLEFGDYRVLIERGKYVYLAIAVSGHESPRLRKEMRELIEEVEEKYDIDLDDFDGFMEPLLGVRDILARAMRSR
ncbi:MAG: hypothetical protein A3K65_09670 [Euryarchaeota archaeon RBG_16_68_12]|nr:MAG: hypothetical protein A3K65_09670 [Euryarchaeota archaeon RBG_16_68_12]